jgi:hypothetical protein
MNKKVPNMKKIFLLFAVFFFAFAMSRAGEPQLILVEQITTSSANSPGLLPIAQQFNQIVNSNSEVIPLTIHTNFNIDQFYKDNPALAERILLYKEQNQQYPIPSFYVNGSEVVGINGLQAKINSEKNKISPIKMKVKLGQVSNGFISVEVKMDLDTTLNAVDQLFCALIEKHINAPGAGNPAEPDFYYVTRYIDLQATRGAMIYKNVFNFSGNKFDIPRNVAWNIDELYAIAWVQNTQTGKVLQAEKQKIYNESPQILADQDTIYIDDSNKNDILPLKLYNSSMAHLQISNISIDNSTDFSLNYNQAEMTLTAGMEKELHIKLNNLEVGEYTANITISSDANNQPTLVIPVVAKVESNSNPVITADVTTLDFGKVSKQKVEKISITNTGVGTLNISSFDFMDNSDGVFSVLNGDPTNLEPNQTLFLEVNFKPKEEIAYFATLQIHSNATNSATLNIAVRGEGENLEQFSSIAVSSQALDFGKTNFTSAVRKSIVIHNGGNIELKLQNSGMEGNSDKVFSFVGPSDITIPAESSDSLVIEFLPKERKEYSANLIIRSNVTDPAKRRIEVALTGEGDGPMSVRSFVEGFDVSYFGNSLNVNVENSDLHSLSVQFYDLNGSLLKTMDKAIGMGQYQISTDGIARNQIVMYKIYSGEKLISTGKFIND